MKVASWWYASAPWQEWAPHWHAEYTQAPVLTFGSWHSAICRQSIRPRLPPLPARFARATLPRHRFIEGNVGIRLDFPHSV